MKRVIFTDVGPVVELNTWYEEIECLLTMPTSDDHDLRTAASRPVGEYGDDLILFTVLADPEMSSDA